jgi:phosphatidylinositol alpha-1,6-mannosyltransferase
VTSLLVTNDFPPKVGGIQSYLYELWRRLPPQETTVLTASYPDAAHWDAAQAFRIERVAQRVLLPTRALAARADSLAREIGADVVFVDPMLPLGLIGPRLRSAPYAVIVHGAEVTVPGAIPVARTLARRVLRGASAVVAAGTYPAQVAARVARRSLPCAVVPPGVDVERFRPLDGPARAAVRARFGLAADRPLVLGVSRLVPRKGFDVLVRALPGIDPTVQVAIAGAGRDRRRLERLAARHAPGRIRFLGRVADDDMPGLYAAADVFVMLCRDRWGGLEAEGFGIVFLEAAACGVPAIAGRSGGAHEAVDDGTTGFVVEPRDVGRVRVALARLLGDGELRARMGADARARAERDFAYDTLVGRLLPVTSGVLDGLERWTS